MSLFTNSQCLVYIAFLKLSAVLIIVEACQCWQMVGKLIFINTSDSFAIPIGGERVTWGCIHL